LTTALEFQGRDGEAFKKKKYDEIIQGKKPSMEMLL
jgi:hypothetical protein